MPGAYLLYIFTYIPIGFVYDISVRITHVSRFEKGKQLSIRYEQTAY